MIGQIISHYRIIEKLGEGGMGKVYKAHDTKLDRILALKFLPQNISASDTDQARFLQEAKAASAINHPNVCIIHDIQEYDNSDITESVGKQQFIIMEYVDGQTLSNYLKSAANRRLQTSDCIDIAIQIADALHAAHERGIIHRDVKSDNIMIAKNNQIKVMDFGLAKLKGAVKLTKSSSTVGTLAYMAPEQLQGVEIDARSDIYSFGVVLFEMLTGELPFQGEYESALIYAILNDEPKPAQKFRPDISSELMHVLNRALEKDAGNRYQNMNDILIDLKRIKRDSSKDSHRISEIQLDSARQKKSKKNGFGLFYRRV